MDGEADRGLTRKEHHEGSQLDLERELKFYVWEMISFFF